MHNKLVRRAPFISASRSTTDAVGTACGEPLLEAANHTSATGSVQGSELHEYK